MEDQIKEFLSDNTKKQLHIPINSIEYYSQLLKNFKYISKSPDGDFSTNGWEIDFWVYFKNNKNDKLCLSGSLWYGDFILTKTDKDEDED